MQSTVSRVNEGLEYLAAETANAHEAIAAQRVNCKESLDEVYDWTGNEFNRLKEIGIEPLEDSVDAMKIELDALRKEFSRLREVITQKQVLTPKKTSSHAITKYENVNENFLFSGLRSPLSHQKLPATGFAAISKPQEASPTPPAADAKLPALTQEAALTRRREMLAKIEPFTPSKMTIEEWFSKIYEPLMDDACRDDEEKRQ